MFEPSINGKGRWIGHRVLWSHFEEYSILEKSDYLECSVCSENYYRMIHDFSGHLYYCRPSYDKYDLTSALSSPDGGFNYSTSGTPGCWA